MAFFSTLSPALSYVSPALSYVVLVITAATLFYVAMTDLREFRIRNELIIALACLFGIHSLLTGHWIDLHWNLAFAFLMFVILLYFYGQNWLGGGDVKILTVAFLWVGLRCAFPFAVLLLIFSIVHFVAAKFRWVSVRQIEGHQQIPFAPSVAAALIAVFMLGCLQPILLHGQLKGGELPGLSFDEIARHIGNTIPDVH
jgi:prepilin peptidase CpaA